MVLLGMELEKRGLDFWNLGHPYMEYKFKLGAIKYSNNEFLQMWNRSSLGV